MDELEKIPKKEFFQVPEDYFDQLPARIQQRMQSGQSTVTHPPVVRYAYALALSLLAIAAIIFYTRPPQSDPVSMLSAVETADLIQFLEESEMTTEEVIESFDFTPTELESLEDEIGDVDIPAAYKKLHP